MKSVVALYRDVAVTTEVQDGDMNILLKPSQRVACNLVSPYGLICVMVILEREASDARDFFLIRLLRPWTRQFSQTPPKSTSLEV